MTRRIPPGIARVLNAEVVQPFFALDFQFDTAPVKLWTGVGDLVVGDDTYTGGGVLLNVSDIQETSNISATGAKISITSIPTEVLALALKETYQGRRATIYFGLLDVGENYLKREDGTFVLQENLGRIVINSSDELINVFSGYLDTMNIVEGPATSSITISIESKLIDIMRDRIQRYTSGFQNIKFPFDLGFDGVEGLQDVRLDWGR